ncbi:MAG TPA: dTMP kinase [Massilibacterium sp.]|nr:dTMP kinase [Massilibacterium sp.]
MMKKGLFITFEGPDGSGKSTQIQKLAHYLEENDISYVLTREPGGTRISDLIRGILLNPEHQEMKNNTEVLLYAASRAQHIEEKIKPALAAGKIVLCDRFVDASIAYQGYGLGIDLEMIQQINQFAIQNIMPNRTYLFDISPEEGRKRMMNRLGEQVTNLDRIEQKTIDYHVRVRKGFEEIANQEPHRITRVDGSKSIDTIAKQIRDDFNQLIKSE